MPKGVYPRNKPEKEAFFGEVFNGTIEDVKSHPSSNDKPVKEIIFATEQSNTIDPITKRPWIVKHSSFVREVYDKDINPLSEVDLLALRGHRVEVLVYPNCWIIRPIDEE